MAVLPNESTEKRIVETTPDGTVVSSEPLPEGQTVHVQPYAQVQPAQIPPVAPPPQVIRVKSGGSGPLYLIVAVLVLALGGVGYYLFQNSDSKAAEERAVLQQQQQQAAVQQRLQQIGEKAQSLGDEVRDAQRDIAVQPSTGAPLPASPSLAPAPAQPAPASPAPAAPH